MILYKANMFEFYIGSFRGKISVPVIDPCRTNNGGCEHKCASYGGRVECQCYAGYQLADDNKLCLGKQLNRTTLVRCFFRDVKVSQVQILNMASNL